MRLAGNAHLAYCTNIHRGESWPDTFAALERDVLAVRRRVCPADQPYAIGLRLGAEAASQLTGPTLAAFRHWLDTHNAYLFTINGFPYGSFHGTRVKEQVYAPDWATQERVDYTLRLFDILAALRPADSEGSVSTVPVSFKAAPREGAHHQRALDNLRTVADHLDELSERSNHDLHLALEPEPLCVIETTDEAIDYFAQLRDGCDAAQRGRLQRRLGINYDTCHLACEFEPAGQALGRLHDAGIRIGKLHLSSALRLPDPTTHAAALAPFVEPTYLHQVIGARQGRVCFRLPDLDLALHAIQNDPDFDPGDEWRVHFHVPLHARPEPPIHDTHGQLLAALDWLAEHPGACHHLEMETYTWDVLPGDLKSHDVVDQLAAEYAWTFDQLRARKLA